MINHKLNGDFKSHIILKQTRATQLTQEGLIALLDKKKKIVFGVICV
jgi:hypothetical protein